MSIIYQNLLQSKKSTSISLEDGQSIPMNHQIYSEWDCEYIIYTLKPIFGSTEDVWLSYGSLHGLYKEDQDLVIFDPNDVRDFEELVLTNNVVMLDSIDTLIFLEELEEVINNNFSYEYMYIHIDSLSYFSKRRHKSLIDTSKERFGYPHIDTDLPF